MYVAHSTDGSNWIQTFVSAHEAIQKLAGRARHGFVKSLQSNEIVKVVYNGRIIEPHEFVSIERARQAREWLWKGNINSRRQAWGKK